MKIIHDRAPRQDGDSRTLLVMLPGATDMPEDFLRHGFVQALRERHLPVDVILAGAHADYYIGRSIGERLSQDVVLPACNCRYRKIWLLGISLGGMGALICARSHPDKIDGVILLAPYLGNRGKIAAIANGGGLDNWQPETIPHHDNEHVLLAWLKVSLPGSPALPEIHLGYGMDDRFAPASALLAQRLPADRVTTVQGGHDWETWRRLWKHILDQGRFSLTTTSGTPPASSATSR